MVPQDVVEVTQRPPPTAASIVAAAAAAAATPTPTPTPHRNFLPQNMIFASLVPRIRCVPQAAAIVRCLRVYNTANFITLSQITV